MNLKLLLVVSVAANVALIGYVSMPQGKKASVPVTEAAASAAAPKEALTPGDASPSSQMAGAPSATNAAVRQFDWQSVESADYKEYIGNLRAIGCPDQTIRDIILADVNKLFDDKKRQARGAPRKYEFWKASSSMMGIGDPADLQKGREIDKEREAMLRGLGIEPDFRTQMSSIMSPVETMFDFIDESKRAEVLRLMSTMQEAVTKDGSQMNSADVMKAQKEMEVKVKALLTPEEALQYDLRLSMSANLLRTQLGGFDPTEDEFMKVFELRKAFDDQHSPFTRGDEKEKEKNAREAAEKVLKEQIKESIGETRYAAYERAQNYEFQQMLRSATRGDLGALQAVQAWEMKQAAEQQAKELRGRSDMTAQDRNAALLAIRQETEASLKATLGEKGWDEYNRPMNTSWLQRMSPNTTLPPPVKVQ